MGKGESFRTGLDRVARGINVAAVAVAGAALVFMTLGVSYEVVARYLFNSPTKWAMEGSEFALLVSIYLATGYILMQERHVRMDLITNKLQERTRGRLFLVVYPVGLLFSLLLAYEGWDLVSLSREAGFKSIVMKAPLFLPQLTVPIGGALLSLAFIYRWFKILAELRGRGEASPTQDGGH